VRVYVKEGWTNRDTGKKGEPRLQFNSFQLLHDVMDSHAKKLSIQLDIKNLQESRIRTLKNLFDLHKGNHALNFEVFDMEEELKIHMPSRKQKVQISQELIDELENEGVKYKLN